VALIEYLPYFQLAGQTSLVLGVVFAAYQLLQSDRQRQESTALNVVTSFNTLEFRTAFAKVYQLPLGATAQQVRDHGREMEEAATTVMMTFEMLGVLVHNRMVPIDTLDQAIGGFLRESWRRLEGFVKTKRAEVGSPRWGEWYQWLYEHLATNPRRAVGAYEAFRDWKP